MLKEAILRYMVIYQVIYIIFAQKTINPRAPMLTWATLCHTLNQRINKLYQYQIQYTKPRGKGGEGHPLNKLKIYTHSHASISLSQIRYLQWIYHKNKISWIQGQGQLKKKRSAVLMKSLFSSIVLEEQTTENSICSTSLVILSSENKVDLSYIIANVRAPLVLMSMASCSSLWRN